ncbi:Capsular polysaccharide phosphotransferase sacB [Entamoeba marina]
MSKIIKFLVALTITIMIVVMSTVMFMFMSKAFTTKNIKTKPPSRSRNYNKSPKNERILQLRNKQQQRYINNKEQPTYGYWNSFLQALRGDNANKNTRSYDFEDTVVDYVSHHGVCDGRIDVVWTYVNGSETEFLKRLSQYKKIVSMTRYRDYGSLFYSMRSVYQNVKFAKKWFLVVQSESQIPTFLNQSTFGGKDGYQLEIVFHHQIFPNSSTLPTFNSAAIESNFHRIPGLSECFIYMNDDFFIHKPINSSWFVEKNGIPKIIQSPNIVPRHCPWSFWSKQLKYSNNVLNKLFYTPRKERHRISHNAYLFKKSILEEMWGVLEKEFTITNAHRFRMRNDLVIPFVHGQYALENLYASSYKENQANFQYFAFNENPQNSLTVIEQLNNSEIIFYCINDEVSNHASEKNVYQQSIYFQGNLNKFYPEPTPFEL